MNNYEIFISFKNTDSKGDFTYDNEMAQELYDELVKRGCTVFYSRKSLSIVGASQYKFEIDQALDSAKVLIVVGSSRENMVSSWVRYEWDSFYGDILNGNTEKKLFSYIDRMNTIELPRTLRQLQCFEKNKISLTEICDYVCSAIGKNNNTMEQVGNEINLETYSYHEDREAERLSSQARLVYENDLEILTPIIAELTKNGRINILDVGCADGFLTKLLFGNFNDRINCLVGLDRDTKCISIANKVNERNYHFYTVEFEDSSFENRIKEIMRKEGIESFDLVFSALVLHHLKNPTKLLRKLRRILSSQGVGYFRSCDDDEILSFPDENDLLRKTLQESYFIGGMSDRIHGRKLYSEVHNAGFNEICVKPYYITTAGMDIDERIEFFFDLFYWRKNRYRRILDLNPESTSAMDAYIKYCNAYDELEGRLYDQSHYLLCAGPIVIGKK